MLRTTDRLSEPASECLSIEREIQYQRAARCTICSLLTRKALHRFDKHLVEFCTNLSSAGTGLDADTGTAPVAGPGIDTGTDTNTEIRADTSFDSDANFYCYGKKDKEISTLGSQMNLTSQLWILFLMLLISISPDYCSGASANAYP